MSPTLLKWSPTKKKSVAQAVLFILQANSRRLRHKWSGSNGIFFAITLLTFWKSTARAVFLANHTSVIKECLIVYIRFNRQTYLHHGRYYLWRKQSIIKVYAYLTYTARCSEIVSTATWITRPIAHMHIPINWLHNYKPINAQPISQPWTLIQNIIIHTWDLHRDDTKKNVLW